MRTFCSASRRTREDIEDADLDIYGVEAGFESGPIEVEGYLGTADGDGDNETVFGVEGRFELSSGLGFSLGYEDVGSSPALNIATTTLRVDKNVSESLNLFAEIGSTQIDTNVGDISEPFVGIGGKITFGAERGATFNQRGVLRILPGL